ncbi:unnamed protein product [Meganyctiphanes norvegica]|uniref:BTB domain-containing protein n=1 Tax=Meganyctiphanes norvegica TaxID=48144 RepID=A0AAV2R757_MEGNR
MEDRLLKLKWSNNKTIFLENLKIQREKPNYTDVTLAVEDKFYPVHKLVMSTFSEYFRDIFERTPCKSPVIVLKDVSTHDIEALLDYMYLGEVNVKQNDLASVLKTAKCLKIKGFPSLDMYLGEVNVNENDLASVLKTAKCLKIKGFPSVEPDLTKVHEKTTRSHDEYCQDIPSQKRRRHHLNYISPNVISPVSSPQMSSTVLDNPAQTKSIPIFSILRTELDEPHLHKVENNYESGSNNDQDPLEGNESDTTMSTAEHESENSDISTTEQEPEKFDSISFSEPKLENTNARKLRDEWLQMDDFKPWLEKVDGDPYRAFCNICSKTFDSTLTQLKRHKNTKIHTTCVDLMSS